MTAERMFWKVERGSGERSVIREHGVQFVKAERES